MTASRWTKNTPLGRLKYELFLTNEKLKDQKIAEGDVSYFANMKLHQDKLKQLIMKKEKELKEQDK